MILSYKECLERYGSDYMIKKEIESGRLYQKEKGVYSDKEICLEIEIISAKYPRAIFTGESAYYYYGLTDVIPDLYCLATKRDDTRIKEKNIKQISVNEDLHKLGKTTMKYHGVMINIYDKERLLIDLIRFKSKTPFDYYKEIILNYRRIVNELDFFKIEEYSERLRNGNRIMECIQLEVM